MKLTRRKSLAGIGAAVGGMLGWAGEASACLFGRHRARRVGRYGCAPVAAQAPAPAPALAVPYSPASASAQTATSYSFRPPACMETIDRATFDTMTSFKLGQSYTIDVWGSNFSMNSLDLTVSDGSVTWDLSAPASTSDAGHLIYTATPRGTAGTSGLSVTVLPRPGVTCNPKPKSYSSISYT